jgi:hypothetical protein
MEELTLRGAFDLPAAIALQAKLMRAPTEGALQIDFSDAQVSHVALAGLGAWLASRGRKVMAVGLREADLRLLQFLGFSTAIVCEA